MNEEIQEQDSVIQVSGVSWSNCMEKIISDKILSDRSRLDVSVESPKPIYDMDSIEIKNGIETLFYEA